jgi:hypothetical protein
MRDRRRRWRVACGGITVGAVLGWLAGRWNASNEALLRASSPATTAAPPITVLPEASIPDDPWPGSLCLSLSSFSPAVSLPDADVAPPPTLPLMVASGHCGSALDARSCAAVLAAAASGRSPCLRNWAWSHAAGTWKLAVGLAAGVRSAPGVPLAEQPLLSVLGPTLRRSLHPAYAYRLHLTHDADDGLWAEPASRDAATAALLAFAHSPHTPPSASAPSAPSSPDPSTAERIEVSVHWHACPDCAGRPAWAHSHAAVAAVAGGAEYVFRINDDTAMPVNAAWTRDMIEELTARRVVPNVGVTGPDFDFPVPTPVLSHDFTHRTHVLVHGWHYPPTLPDW